MASAALTINRLMGPVIKPVLFLLACAPLLKALGEIGMELFGLGRSSLGANPVEELLNRGGIWGLNLLVLTLCVTPLRQLTGWHAIGRVRRMLGLFAFFYLSLHLTVYLTLDRALEFDTIVEDVLKRPYITIGFTGLMLLVPLAITSFDALRRRMGRAWPRLHSLVYVVVLLGLWHYFWQVKKDIANPLMYATVVALLLGWRVYRHWRQKQQLALRGAATDAAAPMAFDGTKTAERLG